jgi:FtsP/CotA-like multicopper oxidase with cupredoxin domain
MKNLLQIGRAIGLLAALTVGLAASGWAGGGNDAPNVTKPYYYQPPGGSLNATDRLQLMVYRDQLQLQQQSLQLQQDRGTSSPVIPQAPFQQPINPAIVNSQLFQTQSELDRVNGLLNSAPGSGFSNPGPMTGSQPLPIVPTGMGTQFVITVH